MSADLLSSEYQARTLVFFALGGGGARVLEALLHLCSLGLGPARLRVLVVDPDEANGSVQRALRALNDYRDVRDGVGQGSEPEGFFRTEVELLAPDIPVWSPLAGDLGRPDTLFSTSVDHALMAHGSPGLDTLFDLLYSARLRELDLSFGFRGVPSVGAVFMNRLVSEPMFAQLLAHAHADPGKWRFFATGSVFGGTGAAALPAIVRALRAGDHPSWRGAEVRGVAREALGAALLLPYFKAPAAPEGEGDCVREWSAALGEHLDDPGYGAYYLLGDSIPRGLNQHVAGGAWQRNTAHFIEFFAALGALDFAARGGVPGGESPVYRILGLRGDNPEWGDLPMSPPSRAALRSALVAMHVFLTELRPNGREWPWLGAELTGVTWAELLRLDAEVWVRESPALDAMGRFWRRTWEWLREMRRGPHSSLSLVNASDEQPGCVPVWSFIQPGGLYVRPARDDVYTVFRHWNVEAHRRRGGGFKQFPAVMRLGTERYDLARFASENDGAGGSVRFGRWLLPPLKPAAPLASFAAGEWRAVDVPAALRHELRVDDSAPAPTESSSPSPWARMLLFRDAMRDSAHPARAMVENEILDALELVWASGLHAVPLEMVRIQPDALADTAVSPRAAAVAEALANSAPYPRGRGPVPAITVVRVDGRPVAGSSPYTLCFTAADAADERYPYLFGYARGERPRSLHERPSNFQTYVAAVILPQLLASTEDTAGDRVFLRDVLTFLQAAVFAARHRPASPVPEGDWRAAAAKLDLTPAGTPFAGVELFVARTTQLRSPWMLRPSRIAGPTPPLVMAADVFDGVYGEGLPSVRLPASLENLERDVLPVTRLRHPWVAPEHDWFTGTLLHLAAPLDARTVVGAECYRVHPAVSEGPLARPQLALPLTAEFFRWFTPEDVPRMLSLEVRRTGEVEATLRVPVGPDDKPSWVTVRRVYSHARVYPGAGPELAVWPAFAADDWTEYAVFRVDSTGDEGALQLHAFSRGIRLEPLGHTRRSDVASTYAFGCSPEVLELRATERAGAAGRPLGVILPRYRTVAPLGAEAWCVGIDVGSENTAIAIARDGESEPVLLACDPVTLPLTLPGADFSSYVGTYFLPERILPAPFPSAAVYQTESRAHPRAVEPVALNLNILFSEPVRTNDRNRVATAVTSADPDGDPFVSVGFARAAAMLVLASARERGVAPRNVTFVYGTENTSAMEVRSALRFEWQLALATDEARTAAGERAIARLVDNAVDVGLAAMLHFSHRGALPLLVETAIVFDVGAAATGFVACARGRISALDSLVLSGRHLTAARGTSHGGQRFSNPFVRAFAAWAVRHGLPPSQADPLKVFASRGNDSLAFRHLVHTQWFQQGGAERFRGTAENERFRGVLFYFFGALFHLAGLLSRAARSQGGDPVSALVFAGNGSRFLSWLAPSWAPEAPNPLRDALLGVFTAAAGDPAGPSPRVLVSDAPKEEVARGLAITCAADRNRLSRVDNGTATLLGERLMTVAGALEPTARVRSRIELDPEQLQWAEGPMEIERFHQALVEVVRTGAPPGTSWFGGVGRLPDAVTRIERSWIQDTTRLSLSRLRHWDGTVPGNLFALEASVVVERLIDTLFERP
ncbi:MAG TPA: hypothetical protein VGB92_09495 [Longimicrobium sp.]|jgi:hypothetical protein